jgi:hypothetical protein
MTDLALHQGAPTINHPTLSPTIQSLILVEPNTLHQKQDLILRLPFVAASSALRLHHALPLCGMYKIEQFIFLI